MAKAKKSPPSKAVCAHDQDWPLGSAFGLVPDGGWVDALRREWMDSSLEMQGCWNELISLCRDARPRCGSPWVEAEDDAAFACGEPLEEIVEGEEEGLVHEPGTQPYQAALERVAPNESWLEQVRLAIEASQAHGFPSKLAKVCRRAFQSGIGTLNRNGPNKEILRGLIWCVVVAPNPELIDALQQVAAWSIQHRTAQAKTIGIALAFMNAERAAAALHRIEGSAPWPSTRSRFGRYASHVERKLGITPEDGAERFIPTFDLDAGGTCRTNFPGHAAVELSLQDSNVSIRYFNNAGDPVAAPPAAVKRDHAPILDEVRAAAKGLKMVLKSQQERIESLLQERRVWEFGTWRERYLDHPVVGTVARRLIWQADDRAVLFFEGRAIDRRGETIAGLDSAKVALWHPIDRRVDEVKDWRQRLETLEVTQPFKQAHREIYLLTDAERKTATYSNRFAGHILSQSQFRALAATRHWTRPYLGGWDEGDSGTAMRQLADGWRVEFWLQAASDEISQRGGLLYVSTDQVRFYREGDTAPSALADVPPVLFSEAMRDVDLFVGVASVGNHPEWSDGGPGGRYRDYWQSYSFGELGATAQTRKEVLQRLVPRLTIAGQCSFADKFLVVKGSRRTYKIHLGSGNILMEPNDQYLCIVSDRRSAGTKAGEKLYLPFEGDSTLSVILSKAFLLAEDQKIKDPTILQQLACK